MSVLTTLLFYYILPPVVRGFAWLLERTLGVGGAGRASTAANIFRRSRRRCSSAPIWRGSRSELFVVMTGGMAGIAGTVLVIYATILGPVIPNVAAPIASVLAHRRRS
jgi:CNT family concentrative nucleoside transporter